MGGVLLSRYSIRIVHCLSEDGFIGKMWALEANIRIIRILPSILWIGSQLWDFAQVTSQLQFLFVEWDKTVTLASWNPISFLVPGDYVWSSVHSVHFPCYPHSVHMSQESIQ